MWLFGVFIMSKKGFTLIELLVVISIIALLLAILMPSLSLVKEKAKFTVCKTNLKQYGLAMAMYSSDWDGGFPEAAGAIFDPYGNGSTYACQWHDSSHDYMADEEKRGPLYEYMESDKIHLCPTFVNFAKAYGSSHPGHNSSIPIDPVYSYSQNVFFGREVGGYERLSGCSARKGDAVCRRDAVDDTGLRKPCS